LTHVLFAFTLPHYPSWIPIPNASDDTSGL